MTAYFNFITCRRPTVNGLLLTDTDMPITFYYQYNSANYVI